MKNLFTVLACLLTFSAFAQYGEVLNGSFESWSVDTLFSNPSEWNSSNNIELANNVERSTDAQNNTYSAYMETTLSAEGDTLGGYVILGQVDNGFTGVPYTSMPNELSGYLKYDIASGDTGFVMIQFFLGGNPIAVGFETFTGSQSSWSQFTMPINLVVAPDSMWVGVACSNLINETNITPGSWMMVDNLVLSGTGTVDPVPNGDFENWDDVTASEPNNWSTLNPVSEIFGFTSAGQSLDAADGSFAVALETFEVFDDTVPGILTNGELNDFEIAEGIPYQASPTNFSFCYKYAPMNSDTAWVGITFLDASGTEIFSHVEEITGSNSTYNCVNIPITLPATPDTMAILAISGNMPGSVLMVDDFELTGGDVAIEELLSAGPVHVYPNPARDHVTLMWEQPEGGATISVIDMSGRVIVEQNFAQLASGLQQQTIDLPDVSPGIYVYRLQTERGETSGQLMIK